MKSTHLVRAAVLAAAVTVALSSAVSAGRESGLLYQYTEARADLTQEGLWECGSGQDAARATIYLAYVEGRNFTDRADQRGPIAWRDLSFHFQIFPCEGETFDFEGLSLDLSKDVPPERMWIIPLTAASLDDVTHQALQGDELTDIFVTYDLTWAVPPTSSVVNSHEDGAPQRIADAVVSGTVEVSGLPAPWPETVTFIVGNDHDATIVEWLAGVR